MQLTPHFSLEEFTLSSTALALRIHNLPTEAHLVNLRVLAERMEEVRALFGALIEITSGYRNPQVNQAVRGVPARPVHSVWRRTFTCTAFTTSLPHDAFGTAA